MRRLPVLVADRYIYSLDCGRSASKWGSWHVNCAQKYLFFNVSMIRGPVQVIMFPLEALFILIGGFFVNQARILTVESQIEVSSCNRYVF